MIKQKDKRSRSPPRGISVHMPGELCGVETSPPPRLLGTTSAFFSWPSPLDSSGALPLNSIPLSILPVYWLKFLHGFHPPPFGQKQHPFARPWVDSSQWLWGSLSALAPLPAMPASMLLLVLYYHCLQTAPLNISRALFYWVCWVTTDAAVRRSNCPGVGISSHKGWNFVLLLSHQPIFSGIDKKKNLLFHSRLQKQNELTWCQRKFIHVTNC